MTSRPTVRNICKYELIHIETYQSVVRREYTSNRKSYAKDLMSKSVKLYL